MQVNIVSDEIQILVSISFESNSCIGKVFLQIALKIWQRKL